MKTGTAFGMAAIAASLTTDIASLVLQAEAAKPSFERCGSGIRINCIVDGDTLWNNGIKIRLADIDTPEISQPHCAAEKALGERATIRLMELVNAGPFQMQAWPGRDEDKYGRKLRVLVRDSQSLGDMLVSEGLARTWAGRRQPWCDRISIQPGRTGAWNRRQPQKAVREH